jgi:predicted oxidoreductase (fatty acid repression mutant protein)
VARILDNDEHKELWTEAEAALVEVLEACYWEPEYRQRRHLAAVKT